jgi:outer membrane protein assembly factor BamB
LQQTEAISRRPQRVNRNCGAKNTTLVIQGFVAILQAEAVVGNEVARLQLRSVPLESFSDDIKIQVNMDRHLKSRWTVSIALVLSGFILESPRSVGQPFGARAETNEGTLIQAPREIERLLEQAKQAIDREAWTEATLAVGMLLGIETQAPRGEIGSQDFFLQSKVASKEPRSIRESAMLLIEEIPDAGMKVFELRYGLVAQQAFDQATKAGDWSAIERIARDYCPTMAGREAAWLVAESKIGSGQPLEAAVWLSRLMRQSRAQQQFGFGGVILAAACWKASGELKQAEAILESGKNWFEASTIQWQGKALSSDSSVEELLAAIDIKNLVSSARKEKNTRWVGGNTNRNGDYPAGVPLPLVNWTFQLHESDQHGEAASKTIKQKSIDRNSLLIPARSPLVVPPWVFAMSYDQRIYAIHLRTGKLMWTDNSSHIPADVSSDRVPFREPSVSELPIPDYLARRVWGEAALGQLSSDGQNIYSLSELPSSVVSDQRFNGGNALVTQPRGRSSFNVLHAWSIPKEGKVVWEVGSDTGLMEPGLAGVLFLGPPIEHEGNLYILGELNGEVYLFCLSPDSGAIRWKQQLIANQSVQLASDSIRRNMCCTPAIADGQILCPTLSGQLVSLDLGSRNLRWAHRYDLSPDATSIHQFNQWGVGTPSEFHPLRFRSTESSVVISGTSVIHAPPDSNLVYAVDLFSGERIWELNRSSTLFVAGVWNDKVLFIQDQSAQCYGVKDGKPVWTEPLSLSTIGHVAGRGVRNGGRYFLPIMNNDVNEILEIDFDSGKIVDRMRVNESLGNLTATADQLISLSAVELSAYSIRDRLRAEIDLEFAQDKNSTGRLQREGKIRLAEGKLAEALDSIEAAYRMNRDDPEVRLLLKEVALMAMKQDFQQFSPRVAEYEDVINLGSDRTLYLVSLIIGLQREKQFQTGFRKMLEFTDIVNESFGIGSTMPESIEPEINLQVRQDIWASAKLAQFYESMNPAERLELIEQLKPRIDALTKTRTSRDYGQRSDMFRWLPFGQTLRLNDARNYSKDREWLLAEDTLEEIIEVVDWEQSRNKNATQADGSSFDTLRFEQLEIEVNQIRLGLMTMANRWTTAAKLAQPAKMEMKDILGKLNEQVASDFLTQFVGSSPGQSLTTTSLTRFSKGLEGWPKNKPTVEIKVAEQQLRPVSGGENCIVKQVVGTALMDWSVTKYAGFIELASPTCTQRLNVQLDFQSEPGVSPSVYFLDSIAIIESPTELIAIDTLRISKAEASMFEQPVDCVIWRRSFGKNNLAEQASRGLAGLESSHDTKLWGERRLKNRKGFAVAAVSHVGVLVVANNGTSLIALDPRTGMRRWSRTGLGGESQSLPTVALEKMQVGVLDQIQNKRLVLDARDGRLIEEANWHEKVDVWCTSGRHVLGAVVNRRDETNLITFKLIDAFVGKVVREASFMTGVVADVCQHESFVALTKQGQMTCWNLRTGVEKTYSLELPPNTNTKSMALERFGDRMLLSTDGPSFDVEGTSKSRSSDSAKLCRGPMIALNFTDGAPLWDKPRIIHQYLLPMNQPRVTPVVTLERQFRFKVENVTTESSSIALLDLRDGSLLFANDYLDGTHGFVFQYLADLEKPELLIQRGNSNILVGWKDKENATLPDQETLEIGKITKSQLESQVPKDFVERLQSRMTPIDGNIPGDIFEIPRRRERIK